jgi:hypothetical protein
LARLERVAKKLQETEDWTKVLPGLARLSLEQDEGVSYSLRIVKDRSAAPVRVVRKVVTTSTATLPPRAQHPDGRQAKLSGTLQRARERPDGGAG